MDHDERIAWAQFRFSVIAPFVCRRLDTEEQRRALRKEILEQTYVTPDGHQNKFISELFSNGFGFTRNTDSKVSSILKEAREVAAELFNQRFSIGRNSCAGRNLRATSKPFSASSKLRALTSPLFPKQL